MTATDQETRWDAAAPVWRRWCDVLVDRADLTHLAHAIDPRPGGRVLDVATGVGEPALRIARAVGPTGHVIAADVSCQMLAVAAERAQRAGLRNIEFRHAPAEQLRFAPASFDGIVSACSLPFLDDPAGLLHVARRWLRARGRLAISLWTPGRVPLLDIPVRIAARATGTDPAAPDEQHHPDRWITALHDTGYVDLEVEEVEVVSTFSSPAQFVAFSQDVNGRARSLLATLSDRERDEVWSAVSNTIQEHVHGQRVVVCSHACCVTARPDRDGRFAPSPQR